jgi:nicotinate phosphoribosyltransferase
MSNPVFFQKAGKLSGIHVSGTHAHAFVQSYTGFANIKNPMLARKKEGGGGEMVDFVARVKVAPM